MLDPVPVRGFLDVTGAWDPTLVFVLGGAVGVAALGTMVARLLARPALTERFQLPTNRRIDAPLIGGALLFGIGWGLSGFCPGPAVANLSRGALPVFVFVAAMLLGMGAHRLIGPAAPAETEPGRAPPTPGGPYSG